MRLSFVRLVLGPLQNNVYLLGDEGAGDAVIIDPSFEVDEALAEAVRQGWTLRQVWLTHAHFDHLAGAAQASAAFEPPLPVGLHPLDEVLMQQQGGASVYGFEIEPIPTPSINFSDGQLLSLGNASTRPIVEVRHAPGHSPGSVMFYCEALGVIFCGDVIFREGIGRTDLPGGSYETLIKSIQAKVLSLPESTTLLPGHGPESSVAYEKSNNPYLA